MDIDSIKKGDLVIMRWEDSAGYHDGWVAYENDLKPEILSTAGLVVEVNENYIVVSSSVGPNNVVYSPIAIPWNCVTEWSIIDNGKVKQAKRLSSRKNDSQSGK